MNSPLVAPTSRSSSFRLFFLLAILIGLCSGPFWMNGGMQQTFAEFLIYLALAQLWNLLAGYAGLISIGQQAFVGLGGYALFSMSMLAGVPVLLALPLAGVIAAIVAFPTALIAFRLSGPHFAIGTWVIAEVFRLVFAQFSAMGGGSGTSLPAGIVKTISSVRGTREDIIYWLVLATSLVVVAGIWWLMRSRMGLGLAAMRDDELAAQSAGVITTRLKFSVYIIAARFTGLLGALIFLQKLRISPEAAFSVNDWTVFVIFMVVIGGIGSLEGPILGCIVFFVLREFFAEFGTWYMIGLGALSVGVMIYAPKGIWGLISSRTQFRLFPITQKPPTH